MKLTDIEGNKLIHKNMAMAKSVAIDFYGGSPRIPKNKLFLGTDYISSVVDRAVDVGLDDLISEGYLGLVKAARSYDPSSKAKFTTFAYSCIWQEIFNAIEAWEQMSPLEDDEEVHDE